MDAQGDYNRFLDFLIRRVAAVGFIVVGSLVFL